MPEEVRTDRPFRPHANQGSNRRTSSEERAWNELYDSIRDRSSAEEVIKHLDADPESKRKHLALYLQAKATVRKCKAADVRNQRIAAFVRLAMAFLVMVPARLMFKMLVASRDLVIEFMPAVRKEPAAARSRALKGDPDFADATVRFPSAHTKQADAQGSNPPSSQAA